MALPSRLSITRSRRARSHWPTSCGSPATWMKCRPARCWCSAAMRRATSTRSICCRSRSSRPPSSSEVTSSSPSSMRVMRSTVACSRRSPSSTRADSGLFSPDAVRRSSCAWPLIVASGFLRSCDTVARNVSRSSIASRASLYTRALSIATAQRPARSCATSRSVPQYRSSAVDPRLSAPSVRSCATRGSTTPDCMPRWRISSTCSEADAPETLWITCGERVRSTFGTPSRAVALGAYRSASSREAVSRTGSTWATSTRASEPSSPRMSTAHQSARSGMAARATLCRVVLYSSELASR